MAKHRSQPVAFCILPLILYPYTTNTSHITVLCGKPQIATGCVLYFATNSLAFCILLQHISGTYKKEPVNPDFLWQNTDHTRGNRKPGFVLQNTDCNRLCSVFCHKFSTLPQPRHQTSQVCVANHRSQPVAFCFFATNSLPLHNQHIGRTYKPGSGWQNIRQA